MGKFGPNDPITTKEIYRVFNTLLEKCQIQSRSSSPVKLGFAISGGVDSMALAYLWSQYQPKNPVDKPQAQAFVIDHRLRPQSTQEAGLVASRLKPFFGSPGQILTLDWKPYGGSDGVTSVETTARQLRYQALGPAARAQDIQCIMLGHHADDVVETTILRMVHQSQGRGLVGFKSLAQLPECTGQFGIDSSGAYQRPVSHKLGDNKVAGPETGGILVGRPLLGFPKSRLIATCNEAGVDWVEDQTNQDVALTMRNAIRKMLRNNELPTALCKSSILGLIEKIECRDLKRQAVVAELHDETNIRDFKLGAGVLHFYLLPKVSLQRIQERYATVDISEAYQDYLFQLVDAVSPMHKQTRQTLGGAVQILMNYEPGIESQLAQFSMPRVKLQIVTKPKLGLRIHRSQFYNRNATATDRPAEVILAPRGKPHEDRTVSTIPKPEDFHLWDGRWWMSVQNFSSSPLRIDPMDAEKLATFRASLNSPKLKDFDNMLHLQAPGYSRLTIPTIVCDESLLPAEQRQVDGRAIKALRPKFSPRKRREKLAGRGMLAESFIVALPTLDVFLTPYWEDHLRWDIRYRKISLPDMKRRPDKSELWKKRFAGSQAKE